MQDDKICQSEITAWSVCLRAGLADGITISNPPFSYHDAGNLIIELAERIKAERAVIAMQ